MPNLKYRNDLCIDHLFVSIHPSNRLNLCIQEYKPPASQDIPEEFCLYLYNSKDNPFGVLGSKCTGEPPMLMAVSVFLAVRDALRAARQNPDEWFKLCERNSNQNINTTFELCASA